MGSQVGLYLTVLGLGVQIGTIVFYSFVLTPVLFGQLPRDEAGRAVRLGFPGYYLTGAAALALAMLGVAARPAGLALPALIGAALCVQLFAALRLLPRIRSLREAILDPEAADPDDPAYLEWKRLHGLSVRLNLAALGLGLVALWVALG